MKLYVIRHGESENNVKACFTGWMDVNLTEKGIADAHKAGELLRDVTFDRVYASDLRRAMDTAKNAIPGCTPIPEPLLREIGGGSLEGTPFADYEEKGSRPLEEYGGESYAVFRGRIREFLSQMAELNCDNVAAFSHGAWICGALSEVLGVYLKAGERILCANCTVAIFEHRNGRWMLHSWINP